MKISIFVSSFLGVRKLHHEHTFKANMLVSNYSFPKKKRGYNAG